VRRHVAQGRESRRGSARDAARSRWARRDVPATIPRAPPSHGVLAPLDGTPCGARSVRTYRAPLATGFPLIRPDATQGPFRPFACLAEVNHEVARAKKKVTRLRFVTTISPCAAHLPFAHGRTLGFAVTRWRHRPVGRSRWLRSPPPSRARRQHLGALRPFERSENGTFTLTFIRRLGGAAPPLDNARAAPSRASTAPSDEVIVRTAVGLVVI